MLTVPRRLACDWCCPPHPVLGLHAFRPDPSLHRLPASSRYRRRRRDQVVKVNDVTGTGCAARGLMQRAERAMCLFVPGGRPRPLLKASAQFQRTPGPFSFYTPHDTPQAKCSRATVAMLNVGHRLGTQAALGVAAWRWNEMLSLEHRFRRLKRFKISTTIFHTEFGSGRRISYGQTAITTDKPMKFNPTTTNRKRRTEVFRGGLVGW